MWNGIKRRYTWFRRNKDAISASRLDMFLTSPGLNSQIIDIDMTATTKTDHSLAFLKIQNTEYKRGPGIWKLNTKHLADGKYVEGVINEIARAKNNSTRSKLSKTDRWEYVKNLCI